MMDDADGLTLDGLSLEAIDAAADYLACCGNHYGWWPPTAWRDLDPIGRDEFQAIAANIIRAYFEKVKPECNSAKAPSALQDRALDT